MELAVLAERQHGVVSIRQLLGSLGYSQSAVARATAAGRLHRLHRGVYAVGHKRVSWHGRCLAAVLASSPAVASHASAAWLWGLLRSRPGAFHVTGPTRRHAKASAHMHYARLAREDRAVREGIPVTSLPRTLLDLAGADRFGLLRKAVERAEEEGLFDLGAVDALLRRAGGHPGVAPLCKALALYRPPVFTRSGLERRFLELVEAAGLPTPSAGFNVAGYELDVYWRRERFAVELDVFETHGTRASFEDDRLRQEDLKLIGVEMVRITGQRLDREPRDVMDRVARLLAGRRRELDGTDSDLHQAAGERAPD